MDTKFVWNFRPTLDRLPVFLLYDILVALTYYSNQGGLREPEQAVQVLAVLGVVNGLLFLLFMINLVLEVLRWYGKTVTRPEVSILSALLLIVEWYTFIGGFSVSNIFQAYVLAFMLGTVLCFGVAIYCLSNQH